MAVLERMKKRTVEKHFPQQLSGGQQHTCGYFNSTGPHGPVV